MFAPAGLPWYNVPPGACRVPVTGTDRQFSPGTRGDVSPISFYETCTQHPDIMYLIIRCPGGCKTFTYVDRFQKWSSARSAGMRMRWQRRQRISKSRTTTRPSISSGRWKSTCRKHGKKIFHRKRRKNSGTIIPPTCARESITPCIKTRNIVFNRILILAVHHVITADFPGCPVIVFLVFPPGFSPGSRPRSRGTGGTPDRRCNDTGYAEQGEYQERNDRAPDSAQDRRPV